MKIYSLFIFILTLCFSCIESDIENTNEEVFKAIWDEMDKRYGGFQARNIDWDSIYQVYAPQVDNSITDLQLWNICTEMLNTLDDQHIFMSASSIDGQPYGFSSGKANDEIIAEKEFRLENVLDSYLEDDFFADDFGQGEKETQFVYGKIIEENIGYIYFPHFEESSNDWHTQIDDALLALKDTEGIIVDVRNNGGGFPVVNRYVAKRFMNDEKFIFSIQTRNGPQRTDFDEPTQYFSTPEGENIYSKPIVALINHSTVSAGEEFMLFLESQNHVTVLGTTTSNAFSTQGFDRFLPNGWRFGIPIQLYLYPDGSSPEGVGIIPDIEFKNAIPDVEQGNDQLLEEAVKLL